jgi:hypothetical protein
VFADGKSAALAGRTPAKATVSTYNIDSRRIKN